MFEVVDGRFRLGAERGPGPDRRFRDGWERGANRALLVRVARAGGGGRPVEEGFLADFPSVALASAAVSHPHLVAIRGHGACEIRGEPSRYLVFDRVPWRTLSRVLREEPPPLATALTWCAQLCSALGALHLAGVVHGEVSPDDAIVDEDGAAVLLPPGLARFGDPAGAADAAWLAPEWGAEGAAVGPAADLYSVGCLLYAVVTGSPPFTGSREEVRRAHRDATPTPLWRLAPDVPQRLDRLVRELLDGDPRRRPGDALAVAARLREIADGPLPDTLVAGTPATASATASSAGPDADGETGPDAETAAGPGPLAAGHRTLAAETAVAPGARALVCLQVAGATAAALAAFTGRGAPAATLLSVLAAALVVVLAPVVASLQTRRWTEAGETTVGLAVFVLAGGLFVVLLRRFGQPWYLGVPLAAVGAVAVLATTFLGFLLVTGLTEAVLRARFRLGVRSWAAVGAVVTGVATALAAGSGGRTGWGGAALWGAGAWLASVALLSLVLTRFRRR